MNKLNSYIIILLATFAITVMYSEFAFSQTVVSQSKINQIRAFAQSGDAQAQYAYAYLLRKGLIDGRKDEHEAVRWYEKAAEQGHADAQYAMGNIYSQGLGRKIVSNSIAAKWYENAAEQGNVRAQNSLGALYYYGNGVAQSYQRAAHWYYKAAAQGFPKAQHSLAKMYEFGEGMPKDLKWAYVWYKLAADKGFVESRSAIARCKMSMNQQELRTAEHTYQRYAQNDWAKNTGVEWNNF